MSDYTTDKQITAGDYVRKDGRFQRVVRVDGHAVFTDDGGVIGEEEIRLCDIKLESEAV